MISVLANTPVLGNLIEKLIGQKVVNNSTSMADISKGVLSALAIFLFSYDSGSSETKKESNKYIIIGFSLILLNLMFDGLLALKEKLIKKQVETNKEFAEYKYMLGWNIMFTLNCFIVLFALPVIGNICLFLGYHVVYHGLYDRILHYFHCYDLRVDFAYAMCCTVTGQVAIFQILQKHGPLSLSIYTGTRKLLSILLSIIYFNKNLDLLQMIAIMIGVFIIVWELVEKQYENVSTLIRSLSFRSEKSFSGASKDVKKTN